MLGFLVFVGLLIGVDHVSLDIGVCGIGRNEANQGQEIEEGKNEREGQAGGKATKHHSQRNSHHGQHAQQHHQIAFNAEEREDQSVFQKLIDGELLVRMRPATNIEELYFKVPKDSTELGGDNNEN